jgi:GNAT superfamily N-acetyltransferase
MNIRQAVSKDGLLLSSLSMDVQSLHAEHHPGIFKAPPNKDFALSFFNEVLEDLATRIFIAEKDGQALGYILCKLIERPADPFTFAMRYLLIDQISVCPESRGQGVGAALIKQAEVFAKELGVRRIRLDSWDFNIKAHAFFERLGFQKFIFRFWRDL